MPIATYSDLKTAIVNWAFRNGDAEFIARVPDFIQLAEVRLGRDLRVGAMEKTVKLTTADGACLLPNDYLSCRAVISGGGIRRELSLISPDAISTLYARGLVTEPAGLVEGYGITAAPSGGDGPTYTITTEDIPPPVLGGGPMYYTIVGNAIQTYPRASEIYLVYYGGIARLSDDAPTNWLLSQAPDAYLYASLLESMPYMNDDSRAQVFKAYYTAAVDSIKSADISGRFGRMTTVRRGPTP